MARTRDIDEILRQMAAHDQVEERDFRPGLARVRRQADEAQRTRRRVRRRTLALATSLGLLLIGVALWRDVGTEDFSFNSVPSPRPGMTAFTHRQSSLVMLPKDARLTPDEQLRMAEHSTQDFASGEMQLVRVVGLSLDGYTRLAGVFRSKQSPTAEPFSHDLDVALNSPRTLEFTNRCTSFWMAYGRDINRLIDDGVATYIGQTEFMAEGVTVRCDRWRLVVPEFGTVVYWSGAPLP